MDLGNPRRSPGQAATTHVLWWRSSGPHVPLAREEDLVSVILHWGKKERGMLRDQPHFRFRKIQDKCKKNGITLAQACSLRRHHMSELNPRMSKDHLRLGNSRDIQASATKYEKVIETFLRKQKVPFRTQEQQTADFRRDHPDRNIRGTPDFLLDHPVLLKEYTVNKKQNGKRSCLAERTIHWVEAKMFYGASTVSHRKSTVGSIPSKMRKYVQMFGEGAIVFSQGCGERLATELAEIGVTVLSTLSKEFDLAEVEAHQRTWCARKDGMILP